MWHVSTCISARPHLCLELGIEPFFEDYREESDPFVWLYSINFLPPPGTEPRTLTKSQLACLAVDGYHQNIFETQKAAYSFFGVQRRMFFLVQQIYSYNKDWFSRIRSGDLSLKKALELQKEETKNLGSSRLDILIYTLITAESPVNSGGATKQKSNFSKI